MGSIEKLLIETVIAKAVGQLDAEPNEDDLARLASEIAPEFAEITANILANHIKKDARRGLKRYQRQRKRFEERLGKHWAKPLHLLELTVELAEEVGTEIIELSGPGEDRGNVRNHTFDALVAIHARGCQMSRAILALLRSGFADDAHARWRSLHELAVVSSFISKHGEDVAERYLLHEIVQQRKLARAYKKHEIRAKLDPLTQAEIEALDERYDSLVARFSKDFARDYGWAASALGKDRPTFIHLEEDVGLDHWRPYYLMANHSVHPNSHANYFKLGLHETGRRSVLLSGPSNLGLADPGQGVALSLTQITAALVDTNPTVGRAVELMVVHLLQDATGEAFLRAHKEAEKIAENGLRQRSRHDRRMEGHQRKSQTVHGIRGQIVARLGKLRPFP